MPEKEPAKPANGSPPAEDEDKEFFEAEGVTDPDEIAAIRSRERVQAYHVYKQKKREQAAKPGKRGSGKPWYKND